MSLELPASDPGPSSPASRVASDLPVDLYAADFSGRLPARARDLGIDGVCVETPSVFALAGLRRVVVTLPTGPLELAATGRWQRASTGEGSVLTGIDFLAPPPAAVERLWDVVIERSRGLARHLAASPDLCGLGVEAALGLAQATRLRELTAGRTLYRQDSRRAGDASLFLILCGRVGLHARVRGAREATLEVLGPGRVFGGLPLLAELSPSESAITASEVRLLEIDRGAFACLRRTRPWLADRLGHAVLSLHAARLQRLLVRVGDQL